MKTSALRGWLRKERAREHEAKVAAGEYTAHLPIILRFVTLGPRPEPGFIGLGLGRLIR